MANKNTENVNVNNNNNTTNNNAPAEINTGKATAGQFTVTYQTSGCGACIPVIDGEPCQALMFGYVSESDREGCLNVIREALKATSGDIPAAMNYLYQAALTAANDIKAEEAVRVEDHGVEVIISYTDRKAYLNQEEIAGIDDIQSELPREAVKAILLERAKAKLAEIEAEITEDEYYDPEYEECDCCPFYTECESDGYCGG